MSALLLALVAVLAGGGLLSESAMVARVRAMLARLSDRIAPIGPAELSEWDLLDGPR